MEKIKSFKPIISQECRVLILGSMPGTMSLNQGQYYGNPRNHFWKIIYRLFDEIEQENYNERLEFLKNKRIALWDVINECYREGSLDSNIKKEEVNNIEELLNLFPSIRFIGFNGTKAFSTFKKHVGLNVLEGIDYDLLPSTSPIPGRNIKTFEEKLESWRTILNYL